MGNRVVHFEIEVADTDRAKNFYRKAFGWKTEQMGNDYTDYVMVTTGDPKQTGGINGGIYKMQDKKEVNAFRCVIGVDDINKAIADVKAAGGKVMKDKPDDIPKIGLFVSCVDTEDNHFAMLQPSPDMIP